MPGLTPALALMLASAYFPTSTGSASGQQASETDIVIARADVSRRMTVPIRIGGREPVRFLVDTGAQNTVVSDRLAERLALVPDGTASVLGVSGEKRVDTVTIDELGLGRRSFSGLVAPILQQDDIGADGIVGVDSLQNQRVLIDFKRNVIAIDDADQLTGSRGYDIVVRARRRSGQLIITSARIDGVPVDVIVDTGAESTIGNRALQAALTARKLGGTGILESVTGQEVLADIGFADTLSLGRVNIHNVAIAYADSPPFAHLKLEKRPAILLGMRELRAFDRIAIDFAKRKVLFDLDNAVEEKPGAEGRQPDG